MFLSTLTMPPGVDDYEIHQHLHLQFEREGRGFLFRRDGEQVRMLSIERPKCPSRELPLAHLRPHCPLPFAADLIITRTKFERGKAGKRYDVRDHDERRDWLRRQLADCAEVPFARFRDRMITLGNGARRLVAQTTGTLLVTDAARFAAKLQGGVGRGRAFGCGLLWMPEVMG